MKTSRFQLSTVLYLMAAFAMPVAMLALYYIYGLPVVYADDFDFYPVVQHYAAGHLTFFDLWAQHAEHRMLFPNLLFLLIYKLYAWNNSAICYVTHLFALLSLIALMLLGRRTLSEKLNLPVAVFFSVICFSPIQAFNWLLGFQLQWLLTTLSVCMVAYLFATIRESLQAALYACIPAIIASYSLASGLAIWECVIAALLLSRVTFSHRGFLAWIVIGIATTCGYFIGWKPTNQDDLAFVFHHLDIFVQYIAAYLGSPFAFDIKAHTSMVFGVFGLLLLAACIGQLWRLRVTEDKDRSMKVLPWLILAMFGIANAVITAVGRDAFGPEPALSSRYVTMANFFWYGVIGMAAVILPESFVEASQGARRVAAIGFVACFIALTGCLTATAIGGYREYQSFANYLDLCLLAEIDNNIAPTEFLSTIYAGRAIAIDSTDCGHEQNASRSLRESERSDRNGALCLCISGDEPAALC